ncbi:hypothetical protein KIH74_29870 [Kineosporia sp. J2-2]|uniref:Uncharacterized protein n=1 Tax=Kineosporia corallincola TaxID=2835133 RepID=A0ABS5TQY9_9ACTN|nr:hypothetical protein [Kineosporia corallincola]MBT0773189.1 hypothetical protein [Kineosporia corallincola]
MATKTAQTPTGITDTPDDIHDPEPGPVSRRRFRVRPGLVPRLRLVRSVVLWTALAWLLLAVVLLPGARSAVAQFVPVLVLMVAGFLLTVTRTVRWAALGLVFAASLVWAAATAVTLLLVLPEPRPAALQVAGTALAQLVPPAAVALVAPRRARRFAVGDWVLLGLAAGLGFRAVRELARGLGAPAVPGPGFVAAVVVCGTLGLAVVGWRAAASAGRAARLVSRVSWLLVVPLVWAVAVGTPMVDAVLTLTGSLPEPFGWAGQVGELPLRTGLRVAAVLVVLLAVLVDARHLLTADECRGDLTVLPVPWRAARWARAWSNRLAPAPTYPAPQDISPGDADPAAPPPAAPSPTTSPLTAPSPGPVAPSATTSPTITPPHTAQPGTASPDTASPGAAHPPAVSSSVSPPKPPHDPPSPPADPVTTPATTPVTSRSNHTATVPDHGRRRASSGSSRGARVRRAGLERAAVVLWLVQLGRHTLTVACCSLVAYAIRDKAVILAAHAGVSGESRLTRLVRGRAAMEMTRHARQEAYAWHSDLHRDPSGGGLSQVVVWRVAAVLTLLPALAVLWLVHAPSGSADLSGPGTWWTELAVWQQVLLTGGLTGLAALAAGSLGASPGVSGTAVYLASYGYGAATFVRAPRAATRTYLARATPAGLLADAAELALTMVPVTFGGAVEARGVRTTAEDYLHAFDLGGLSGFLGKAEVFTEYATRAVPAPGHHDVVVQAVGVPSARALAKLILKDASYAGGPVRLIPGTAGGAPAGTAQLLADRLGVRVLAPTDTVHVFESGRLIVGPSPLAPSGRWESFEPGPRR